MTARLTVPPAHFFGVGQEWEWGSSLRAVIVAYHPTQIKVLMRTTKAANLNESIGHEFWYCPIKLGQVANVFKQPIGIYCNCLREYAPHEECCALLEKEKEAKDN